MLHPWEVIGAIQIALYTTITLVSIYPAIYILKSKSSFRWFYIRYSIILLTKIVGGVLLIIYIHNYTNTGLAVATSVFNTIALGLITLLLAFCVRYVDTHRMAPEELKPTRKFGKGIIGLASRLITADYTKARSWDLLAEKLFFAALVVNIVASSIIADNRATAKTLQEVASIIFLAVLVLLIVLIVHKVVKEKNQSEKEYKFILIVLTICGIMTPFLLIRMIYSICAAFAFRVNGTYETDVSKYTFLFGDWKYYGFLGFLQECICAGLFAAMSWVVFIGESRLQVKVNHVQINKAYDSSSEV